MSSYRPGRLPPSGVNILPDYPELRQIGRASREAESIHRIREVRGLYLKQGQTLGSLKGPHKLEPALAQLRGEANNPPCDACRKGIGPFAECVTLRGYFDLACTSCAYNDKGSRCSFRPPPTNPSRSRQPSNDSRPSRAEPSGTRAVSPVERTTRSGGTTQTGNSLPLADRITHDPNVLRREDRSGPERIPNGTSMNRETKLPNSSEKRADSTYGQPTTGHIDVPRGTSTENRLAPETQRAKESEAGVSHQLDSKQRSEQSDPAKPPSDSRRNSTASSSNSSKRVRFDDPISSAEKVTHTEPGTKRGAASAFGTSEPDGAPPRKIATTTPVESRPVALGNTAISVEDHTDAPKPLDPSQELLIPFWLRGNRAQHSVNAEASNPTRHPIAENKSTSTIASTLGTRRRSPEKDVEEPPTKRPRPNVGETQKGQSVDSVPVSKGKGPSSVSNPTTRVRQNPAPERPVGHSITGQASKGPDPPVANQKRASTSLPSQRLANSNDHAAKSFNAVLSEQSAQAAALSLNHIAEIIPSNVVLTTTPKVVVRSTDAHNFGSWVEQPLATPMKPATFHPGTLASTSQNKPSRGSPPATTQKTTSHVTEVQTKKGMGKLPTIDHVLSNAESSKANAQVLPDSSISNLIRELVDERGVPVTGRTSENIIDKTSKEVIKTLPGKGAPSTDKRPQQLIQRPIVKPVEVSKPRANSPVKEKSPHGLSNPSLERVFPGAYVPTPESSQDMPSADTVAHEPVGVLPQVHAAVQVPVQDTSTSAAPVAPSLPIEETHSQLEEGEISSQVEDDHISSQIVEDDETEQEEQTPTLDYEALVSEAQNMVHHERKALLTELYMKITAIYDAESKAAKSIPCPHCGKQVDL